MVIFLNVTTLPAALALNKPVEIPVPLLTVWPLPSITSLLFSFPATDTGLLPQLPVVNVISCSSSTCTLPSAEDPSASISPASVHDRPESVL